MQVNSFNSNNINFGSQIKAEDSNESSDKTRKIVKTVVASTAILAGSFLLYKNVKNGNIQKLCKKMKSVFDYIRNGFSGMKNKIKNYFNSSAKNITPAPEVPKVPTAQKVPTVEVQQPVPPVKKVQESAQTVVSEPAPVAQQPVPQVVETIIQPKAQTAPVKPATPAPKAPKVPTAQKVPTVEVQQPVPPVKKVQESAQTVVSEPAPVAQQPVPQVVETIIQPKAQTASKVPTVEVKKPVLPASEALQAPVKPAQVEPKAPKVPTAEVQKPVLPVTEKAVVISSSQLALPDKTITVPPIPFIGAAYNNDGLKISESEAKSLIAHLNSATTASKAMPAASVLSNTGAIPNDHALMVVIPSTRGTKKAAEATTKPLMKKMETVATGAAALGLLGSGAQKAEEEKRTKEEKKSDLPEIIIAGEKGVEAFAKKETNDDVKVLTEYATIKDENGENKETILRKTKYSKDDPKLPMCSYEYNAEGKIIASSEYENGKLARITEYAPAEDTVQGEIKDNETAGLRPVKIKENFAKDKKTGAVFSGKITEIDELGAKTVSVFDTTNVIMSKSKYLPEGQSGKVEVEYYDAKGHLDSVQEETYNKQNPKLLEEVFSYDKNHKLTEKIKYEYIDNDPLLPKSETYFDENDSYTGKSEFEYDNNSPKRLIKTTQYEGSGNKLAGYSSYEYPDNDSKISKIKRDYDENNTIVQATQYLKTDPKRPYVIERFSDKGELETLFSNFVFNDWANKIVPHNIWHYEDGKPVRMEEKSRDDFDLITTEYFYSKDAKKDAKGGLISDYYVTRSNVCNNQNTWNAYKQSFADLKMKLPTGYPKNFKEGTVIERYYDGTKNTLLMSTLYHPGENYELIDGVLKRHPGTDGKKVKAVFESGSQTDVYTVGKSSGEFNNRVCYGTLERKGDSPVCYKSYSQGIFNRSAIPVGKPNFEKHFEGGIVASDEVIYDVKGGEYSIYDLDKRDFVVKNKQGIEEKVTRYYLPNPASKKARNLIKDKPGRLIKDVTIKENGDVWENYYDDKRRITSKVISDSKGHLRHILEVDPSDNRLCRIKASFKEDGYLDRTIVYAPEFDKETGKQVISQKIFHSKSPFEEPGEETFSHVQKAVATTRPVEESLNLQEADASKSSLEVPEENIQSEKTSSTEKAEETPGAVKNIFSAIRRFFSKKN